MKNSILNKFLALTLLLYIFSFTRCFGSDDLDLTAPKLPSEVKQKVLSREKTHWDVYTDLYSTCFGRTPEWMNCSSEVKFDLCMEYLEDHEIKMSDDTNKHRNLAFEHCRRFAGYLADEKESLQDIAARKSVFKVKEGRQAPSRR